MQVSSLPGITRERPNAGSLSRGSLRRQRTYGSLDVPSRAAFALLTTKAPHAAYHLCAEITCQ